MNPRAATAILLLPAMLALAGCETSTLAHPPLAETTCDARLAGTWRQANEGESDASTQLRIDSRCRIVVTRRDRDGMHLLGPFDLHLGRDEDGSVAWADGARIAASLDRRTPPAQDQGRPRDDADAPGDDRGDGSADDEPSPGPDGPVPSADGSPTPEQDFVVVRYAIAGDRLRVYAIDADASARRLLAAPVTATINRHPTGPDAGAWQSAVHVESPLSPAQFHALIVFAPQPALEFDRQPDEATP